jgi:hypothetical protein
VSSVPHPLAPSLLLALTVSRTMVLYAGIWKI